MSTPGVTSGRDATLLAQLSRYLGESGRAGVETIGGRFVEAAGGVERLAGHRVMVAYGGGKDSTYVVAFVRAVQLHLQARHGATFTLRVANMRHAGVPFAVMENIDRVYRRLEMHDDERTELLTVDHTEIRPFHRDLPLPERVRAMNRLDVLMNGHRAAGDGRPTFCNSCNLAVADFYGRAAWWAGGVDAVVTGDSRREQMLYTAWIMRLAAACGVDVAECRTLGFTGVLTALRGVGDVYFRDLFGPGSATEVADRSVSTGDRSVQPEFVSIYDLVSYRVDEHWELVVDFLGFRFDDLAFSFSESDCANPTLMAHLRGLRTQYVAGRTYEAGILEYLRLAESLMRKKEMPDNLVELALGRYDTSEKIVERRAKAGAFAREAFGLDEDALVAMVFSPFTDAGERLREFVETCHPAWSDRLERLHAVLGTEPSDGEPGAGEAGAWLEEVSGLTLAQLRTLYGSPLVDFGTPDSIISRVRAGDPHKIEVPTVDPATGRPALDLISGR